MFFTSLLHNKRYFKDNTYNFSVSFSLPSSLSIPLFSLLYLLFYRIESSFSCFYFCWTSNITSKHNRYSIFRCSSLSLLSSHICISFYQDCIKFVLFYFFFLARTQDHQDYNIKTLLKTWITPTAAYQNCLNKTAKSLRIRR